MNVASQARTVAFIRSALDTMASKYPARITVEEDYTEKRRDVVLKVDIVATDGTGRETTTYMVFSRDANLVEHTELRKLEGYFKELFGERD